MLKIRIKKSKLKELKKLPNMLEDEYRVALKRVVINTAEYIIGEAKKGTTVGVYEPYTDYNGRVIKTGKVGGTLRNAWTRTDVTTTLTKYKVDVFNPIEYAQYYEYGHRQTPGRYVPQIGKRLKASFVKGRYPLSKATARGESVLSRLIEYEIDKVTGKI